MKVFKMDCQKHFAKIQWMKNRQSKIKPIKIGKQPGTMNCLGRKDYKQNYRPKKVKMTNKIVREKSHFVVCPSKESRFLRQKNELTTNVIKVRWRFIAWSVENIDTNMVTTRNNRLIMQSKCPVCGIKSKDLWKNKKQRGYWVF